MKKEIHTTPIILIMALFLTLIIVLLQSAAFVAFKSPAEEPGHKREFTEPSDRLTNHILTIVQPDSAQTQQIRFLTDQTAARIKSIHHNSRQERRRIMDSLRQQLKPLLTDDQFKRLESVALLPNRNGE